MKLHDWKADSIKSNKAGISVITSHFVLFLLT